MSLARKRASSVEPRLLLDTHVLVRWLSEARKLSREQQRVLEGAANRMEPFGVSAMTLLEIAILSAEGRIKLKIRLDDFLEQLQSSSAFHVFPVTSAVALEVSKLLSLRDPADMTIVATARVNGLRLVTSDARIIASHFVSVIE